MADFPQLDIIAVGAHPDDVEIGCGGTIARLVEQGHKVGIVDLTDGEPTPRSPGPEVRLQEAQNAAEILGIEVRTTLELPNRRLFDSFEARVALAKEFRKHRPRLVIGLGDKTPLASPDHWQAMQITDAAIFYSRLTKWDEQFGNLPVHTISGQLYYTLSMNSLERPPGVSQFVANIGGTLEKKLASIRAYETQFPPEKLHVLDRVRAAAEHYGAVAGCPAGELLMTPRTVRADDVMQFVLGDE
jgi:LmbE family N-acetylglucosaminyl deacetylase